MTKSQTTLFAKSFKIISITCIGVSILTIFLILLLQKKLPPIIPLFYGLPVSQSQLTTSVGLTIPSVASISAILINFIIVKLTKDNFLERVLSGISISTTILAVITTINIFTLVGKL